MVSTPKLFDPDAITVVEIFATRNALAALGLPIELVARILNFAEYWCVQHFSQTTPLHMGVGLAQVRPYRGYNAGLGTKEASSLYLQTGPIGYGEGLNNLSLAVPKKTIFRVVCRDEGENMEVGRIGTFLNHASWLDASIIREDESWTGGDREEPMILLMSRAPRDVLQNTEEYALGQGVMWYLGYDPFTFPEWLCRDGERTKLQGGFKIVPHGERLTWLLQRNRVSCMEYAEKSIEWRDEVCKDYKEVGEKWWTDDYDPEVLNRAPKNANEAWEREWMPPLDITRDTYWKNGASMNGEEAKGEEWPIDGSGSGRDFVKSLQRGDRIGIWARTLVSRPR
jgi:hypothetical protein